MIPRRLLFFVAVTIALGAVTGCAAMKAKDPLQVMVVGVEPLQGEGMELRLLVKLRVQNPNDAPVDYDGVAINISVQGKTFATGVSDAHGNVPRFGEAVIEVPVTASAFRMARQALGIMGGKGMGGKISFEMSGKLNGPGFNTMRFQNKGEFELPTGTQAAPP